MIETPLVATTPLLILSVLFGMVVGSFLNVCIDRLPAGESIVGRQSHCVACRHGLSPLDLVPVLSYLWLRGRCRYCGTVIPPRLPVVELTTGLLFGFLLLRGLLAQLGELHNIDPGRLLCPGLLFGFLAWWYGPSVQLGFALVYASLFLVIFVIDVKHQLILDVVVFPGMLVALAGAFFWPGVGIWSALLGGVVGALLLAIPYAVSRGGMGFGDVKLAGLIGLMLGLPLVFVGLFLGVVTGGLVAAALLALRIKGRKDSMAFGPFLAAGALAALVWGPWIWDRYAGGF